MGSLIFTRKVGCSGPITVVYGNKFLVENWDISTF